ncbi:hypothetical protein EW146_g7411 [Bondarzewia mesenterica]|uniref:Major facilitator superfamily (MFS) profile domain-containing protein n=1 Tax=Bondarzewia mesenterica TaxID=1095465 RepID=A0A4S4LL02_9AGAM|nr:hypothetical protein EW146_g7411 [Bondarzewia mesenterica]
MLQYRVGLFFGAASLAGAFSGLLAFGISFMSGTAGLLGWSWIFILEGIATALVGVLALFVFVDFPATAAFLTPEERSFVVWKKKFDNSSVGEEERFASRHVWSALIDWQVWLHILVYMSIIGPLSGISLFLPTIIHNFGFSTAISQLLTVPPYVFATIVLLTFALWSDAITKRSPFILTGLCMLLIGFTINISDVSTGVKYFGIFFCVAGSYASFPGVVSWLGNNLAGQYKRGVGMAIHIGMGNFAGAIASNVFRAQDSPRYILGHGIMLMFVGIGFVVTPAIVLLYIHINRKRDMDGAEGVSKYSVRELRELGDQLIEDEEDYDVYLFWPSLRLQERADPGNEHSIYGPVLPSFDFEDYYDGLESPPMSPLSLSECSGFRFPNVAQRESKADSTPQSTAGYSKLVKMSLLFSWQVSSRLDRVLEKVRAVFKKAI